MPEIRRICFSVLVFCASLAAHAAEPHWLRISSDHFIVLTDANQKRGHEIAARFEQMRAVFGELLMRKQVRMGEPIEIIALSDPAKYSQLAPLINGQPLTAPGFYLSGEDQVFIVLNASDPDCWRAIEHPLARYFLDYNYPPTQPWFDEGVAEYFASLYFTPLKTELGSDPGLVPRQDLRSSPTDSTSASRTNGAGPQPLGEILDHASWMNLTDLLQSKNHVGSGEARPDQLFAAQSWILVHYLVSQNKLSETGTYFGLVELQNLPVAQAVEQAFGMPMAQLDSAVKNYFHALKLAPASPPPSMPPNKPAVPERLNESALPFSIDEVSTTANQVPLAEATALVDEMKLRIPERREQATQELEQLASDERTDTVVSHRALAWAHIQKGETKEAFEELNSAVQISSSDPWSRFGLALASYHSGEKGAKIQGLANMMESLHIVIDRFPEFAEAYNMLGWARLVGGGANAAVESMKMAVQLSPRNEQYQLRFAEAYLAARKWDNATALLDRLAASQDVHVAASAKKDLHDLPYLKRFGIPPQEDSPPKQEASGGAAGKTATHDKIKRETGDEPGSADENPEIQVTEVPAAPRIDKRPIKFLKAKLLSVDCSQAPSAILLVSKGAATLKLRTPDYKSLVVMGADKFSCEWTNRPVNVNYRADAKGGGDLVSVEVQ
jgi:tetratricopeptide (TPR) repeat protein